MDLLLAGTFRFEKVRPQLGESLEVAEKALLIDTRACS